MKYLRYLSILIFKVFTKIYIYLPILFGILYITNILEIDKFMYSLGIYIHLFLAFFLRHYSRNTVYNYVMQNNIYLPRLMERNPILLWEVYELQNIRGINAYGFFAYRKINIIEYYLALWLLWIWVDDDCNYDTTDLTYAENIANGKKISWLPDFIKDKIAKEVFLIKTRGQFGNAFDLGDNLQAEYYSISSTLWYIRNTAYNFNYMFEEIKEKSEYNFYHRFTTKYFDWHFGYIPYSNSKRKGRLVWFSEDIDKIDKV